MDKQKRLIGVTGTANAAQRENAKDIADALQLRPWRMQQPLFEAIAGMLGVSSHDVAESDRDTPAPLLKTTVGTLIDRLHTSVRMMNHDFLVARLAERMHHSRSSFLYSGDLVTGITTPHEAAWLRARGGLIVHFINGNERSHEVPVQEADVVINSYPNPDAQHLANTLTSIREGWHRRARSAA